MRTNDVIVDNFLAFMNVIFGPFWKWFKENPCTRNCCLTFIILVVCQLIWLPSNPSNELMGGMIALDIIGPLIVGGVTAEALDY